MESRLNRDYLIVERAIRYLDLHYREQPDLEDIAGRVHLSKFHFQRLFSRWAGVSPKKFLQYLTISHAKKLLEESRSVLDVTYEVGLSAQSRLYDLFVNFEALSPGEYRQRGKGLLIAYGFQPSPFGECLIGRTERGICWLSFVQEGDRDVAVDALRSHWSGARFEENQKNIRPLAEETFRPYMSGEAGSLGLHLRGTNFQIKVWEALLNIPPGYVLSYGALAGRIGNPAAARAVGSALGMNPVSLVIPCHRVIRETGVTGNYRWGGTRKKLLLGWETANRSTLVKRN